MRKWFLALFILIPALSYADDSGYNYAIIADLDGNSAGVTNERLLVNSSGSTGTISGIVNTSGSTIDLSNNIFTAGVTVVNKTFGDTVLYGLPEATLLEQAIQDGRAFRARAEFLLDAGESRFFYGKSSGATTETHFRVIVPNVMGETRYSVFLEPNVSGGTVVSTGSMNPHMQAIGSYTSKYGPVRYDPSSVTSYGTELPDSVEWWGNGAKQGGSSSQVYSTILSVNQTLGFKFYSFINANHIRVEFIWWEVPEGIRE